jgi:hypothetical protein
MKSPWFEWMVAVALVVALGGAAAEEGAASAQATLSDTK